MAFRSLYHLANRHSAHCAFRKRQLQQTNHRCGFRALALMGMSIVTATSGGSAGADRAERFGDAYGGLHPFSGIGV